MEGLSGGVQASEVCQLVAANRYLLNAPDRRPYPHLGHVALEGAEVGSLYSCVSIFVFARCFM